ncbi:unnamed protein product [Phytophthora fragariaefolia]|uniref:Unnamed protein product n=1 Tax=Phytophthora fragariaefolia TaxID=1490495 RepID=A0A9W7D6Y9_9STRA|nr:unnamed protein product [Phytophthora fragariaefolia]
MLWPTRSRVDLTMRYTTFAIGVVRTSTPSSSLLDDVRSAYANDADAKQLLDYFSAPSDKSRQKLAKHLRARVHRYRVHNGLLLYSAVDDNADRVVVPDDPELKLRVIYEYHDAPTSGHPGREKTYLLLTRDFYWSHQYKWGAFVENFNKDLAGYRERVRLARERYERFSKRPKIGRLHWGVVEAGIPCAVPMGIPCEHCHVGAVRVSGRDINGYTGVRVPEEHKSLRTNLIAQMASGAAGGRRTLPRAVGDYSSRSSLRHSAALVVAGLEILSNEYENDPDLGSGSDDQQCAGRSSDLSPVRLAVGVEAAGRRRGSGPPDSVDRLEAVERLQTAEFAALRQDPALLKAQVAQVS